MIYNERIRWKEVRVISEDGDQLGIMSSEKALELAYSKGLDLIAIAPTAIPPVCKILDIGKYQYELSKKEKEAKKKQITIDLKEMKYRLRIDENDLKIKNEHVKRFLKEGNRVKITIMFRGREMAFTQQGKELLVKIVEYLKDFAVVSQEGKMFGRNLTMVLEPNKDVLIELRKGGKEKKNAKEVKDS